jgi:hypothetical protein
VYLSDAAVLGQAQAISLYTLDTYLLSCQESDDQYGDLKSNSGLRSTGIAVKAGWDISEFHGLRCVPLDVCVCVHACTFLIPIVYRKKSKKDKPERSKPKKSSQQDET